jgi:heme O synthase-like polyprenyltransferase
MIFSLKKYAGDRAAPSNTTSRTEFDPISTTPTRDNARRLFLASLVYLPVVLTVMLIDRA